MRKEFNVVIEKDADGYFVASVLALCGCHTQAKSLDVLMKRIKWGYPVVFGGGKNRYESVHRGSTHCSFRVTAFFSTGEKF